MTSYDYDFRRMAFTTQKGTIFSYEWVINNRDSADTYGTRLFVERLQYNLFIIKGRLTLCSMMHD